MSQHLDILGPDGAIARTLANYEARPQQLALAGAIADAIAQKRHLLAEAGTGVGKSFAYLVPAIQAACADREGRVVISTHTISLQEQLIRKDLPFLQKVMPQRFSALLVKGRGNYLSRRRLRVAQKRGVSLLSESGALEQLDTLGRWAASTRDGSRADLAFRPLPSVWDLVESDAGNCLGKKCTDYEDCFYFKARRHVHGAQVLVVNHALFFTDLALRSMGRDVGILPKYKVAIFDEAHNLEDVAAEHLGLSIARGQADYLLNKLLNERRGVMQGLLALFGTEESWRQVQKTRRAAEDFFESVLRWRRARPSSGPRQSESLRVREPGIVPDGVSAEFLALSKVVGRIAENVKSDEEQIELDAAAQRCQDLGERIQAWLGQKLPGQVYWIEGTGERHARFSLSSAPIEVGPLLREQVFGRIPSVILTSATLSVGGRSGFEYFKHRLGFPEEHPAAQLGSPFNYREQAELHLYRQMPDPTADARAFEEACLAKIKELVLRTRGRAFVLFTSTQTMQRSADRVRLWMREQGLTLLCQGEGPPPARLLEQFRAAGAAVLFGVDSFWQGVDVQGEALSNVIITKLPFAPPDRPVIEARSEAIAERGEHPFMEYLLPQAVIKLKQGFGRLIRTASDRGLVAILDPRVLTKPYGRRFIEALPECRTFIDGAERE